MNLKKWKVISAFGIFLTSSLLHFIYTWFPNFVTSLFFPVNESIWEHNKIIIGAFLIWAIIEKIYFKKEKNTLFSGFISGVTCAFLVMMIFTPVFYLILKTKDNIIVTFIIFFGCIALSEVVSYFLLKAPKNPKLEKIAIGGFIIVMAINAFLTYYPLDLGIFYDYGKKVYGLGK